MVIARHESIVIDPVSLFIRIIGIHPSDPIAIFRAMEICITAAPVHETEIRSVAVRAITNILKQRVSDSAPTAENPRPEIVSRLCHLEEVVEIPVPENREDCSDFAVITGIAFCAADYVNMTKFCNGKSSDIPALLLPPIRDLLRILWFIRWRFSAMNEAAAKQGPGDATLRLLSFPEFINLQSAKEAIRQLDPAGFSEDLYDLYINGHDVFERDPEFVDFACECAVRITPRVLSRIQLAITDFVRPIDEMPQSHLLLSVLVSHIVPWLRNGIPRAVVHFPCAEVVPNRLLDFEDLELPELPKKPLVIQKPETVEIREMAQPPAQEEEETGERPRQTPEEKALPAEIPKPADDHELSDGEEPPTKPESKPVSAPRPARHSGTEARRTEPKRRQLRLVNVDRSRKLFVPPPMPSPAPQFSPGYYFDPISPHPPPVAIFQTTPAPLPAQSYGPIWDIDPSLYERPYPRPPPELSIEQVSPEVVTAPSKPKAVKITRIQFSRPAEDFDISSLSGDSERDFPVTGEREYPPIDPFPLDEELRRRVDRLLADEVPMRSVSRTTKETFLSCRIRTTA
jgi:hypothetical protein